jgi:hypothetical protein
VKGIAVRDAVPLACQRSGLARRVRTSATSSGLLFWGQCPVGSSMGECPPVALGPRSQDDEGNGENRRHVGDGERHEGEPVVPALRLSGFPSGLVPQNDSSGPTLDRTQQRQNGGEVVSLGQSAPSSRWLVCGFRVMHKSCDGQAKDLCPLVPGTRTESARLGLVSRPACAARIRCPSP